MSKTDELLPCPFCRGPASIRCGGPSNYFVQCDECNATSDDHGEERARAAWNRRAPAQPAVTALDWTDDDGDYAIADTPFGPSYWAHYNGWELGDGERQYCADISEAKAAAQADYERRILSALVSAPADPAPAPADVVEALKRAAFAFRTYADSVEGHYADKYQVARDLRIQAELCDTALRAQGWRAMESAPRDGTSFLGYVPWDGNPKSDFPRVVEISWRTDRLGFTGFMDWEGRRLTVTAWMPLPAAPEAST